MTDGSWLSAIPLTGLVLLLVLLYEGLARKQSKPSHAAPSTMPTRVPIAMLSAFVCSIGTVLLIPWAAALPLTNAPGLLLGTLFIAFLTVGVLYALRDVDAPE